MILNYRGVYPLYPQGKRFLKAMLAIYGMIFAACFTIGVTSTEVPLMTIPFGVLSLGGILVVAHLFIVAVEPPKEMKPLPHETSPLPMLVVWVFGKVVLSLVGDERRPLYALLPAAVMVGCFILFSLLGYSFGV